MVLKTLDKIKNRKKTSKMNRFAKTCFLKICDEFTHGQLTLQDLEGTYEFGDSNAETKITMKVLSPDFYNHVLSYGENGLAESYIEGLWTCDDLTLLLQIGIQNLSATEKMNSMQSKAISYLFKLDHQKNKNSRVGSRRNISAHYDLGNEFFKLFLDPTLTYSCGMFNTNTQNMKDASIRKIDVLCRKLDLKVTDHLIEIGSGWGAFCIHAAKEYGCKVTTTTISENQYNFVVRLVKENNLEDKITILKQDYRDLTGQYDKLVSVEMIEAVGHEFMGEYFEKCSSLLKPNGLMAIQAITIQDQNYHQARKNIDFIKRYVFPGSCLPSNQIMLEHVQKRTDLSLRDCQDIGQDYATTLKLWHQNFMKNVEKIKALGLNEDFIRLWKYYFSYCEAGFRERHSSAVQLLLSKPLHKQAVKRVG